MKSRLLLCAVFGLTAVFALVVAGCGGQPTAPAASSVASVPTLAAPTTIPPTPMPTAPPPTPTPTAPPGPKIGRWEGEPSVSFTIAPNGRINDFKITIPLGTDKCTITYPKEIAIEADGSFTFAFGVITGKGSNTIQGKFESPSTVTGSYSDTILCADASGKAALGILGGDRTWSAKWKDQ